MKRLFLGHLMLKTHTHSKFVAFIKFKKTEVTKIL